MSVQQAESQTKHAEIEVETKTTAKNDTKTRAEDKDKEAVDHRSGYLDRSESALHNWKVTEESKINYLLSKPLASVASVFKRKSAAMSTNQIDNLQKKSDGELIVEEFSEHVTSLMNEDNYWGCFYVFPELYSDTFSPVVKIRDVEDVPELVGGELTRDMITACLTYLARTPILGDLVYIKLNLSGKHLIKIDVLEHYKFLVYLDLSSNLLTELNVLSNLPYLQFLSVAFNRLGTILEYKTPQWFLTEVHYKYNSVKRIRDLTEFWSITVLDLSHNNIKSITGLQNLKYLRRLDLSFNHIQRLENLNHLRLLWLDVSYNNISSCEFGPNAGLWTLLHLEYLNLNENNLTSMKMFSYCTRLRELHLRNNRLSVLLELAVYMRQMRRLIVLDLRANPICATPGYKNVVINTFSILLSLDAAELDPIEQRTIMMDTRPDISMHATRKLLRLIYIQQLSKAKVSPYIPPADTVDVPIVVLVGHEGVGKGALARRLATECSANIQLALQHTTADFHFLNHYKEITRSKFDDMLLAGDFLTYTEMDGHSYGLSREEAFITEGKVKIVCLDLPSALMLKLRGYRPYMILTTYMDSRALSRIQDLRKAYRDISNRERMSLETPLERSTLQVLLSGRIIITGIINEILLSLPDDKEQSEFMIESECSLMMDSEARKAIKDYAKGYNILALLNSSTTSLDDAMKAPQETMEERSLYSLFKESQGTAEYTSDVNGQNQGSFQERSKKAAAASAPTRSKQADKHSKHSSISHTEATQRLMVTDSSKSSNSKSVTFTSQEEHAEGEQVELVGLIVEPPPVVEKETKETDKTIRSISTRIPWQTNEWHARHGSNVNMEDSDLWLAFLTEAGYLQASDTNARSSDTTQRFSKIEDDSIIRQINDTQLLSDPITTSLTDPYEHIHRKCPGLFWDTVAMDNADAAFVKVRGIIRNIINSQKTLKPMFDIDFAHYSGYPTVQNKLNKIRSQIAPQQLFY
ncbi:uncharacterized protein LOC110382792 [Helicoverpa armigera]|uniref:uncharacterized protein LOC110382792 n=1 Tax=Helicoverpa armigera TaxID=29058 RepID=UPI003082DA1B